jgi:hypothetical protein
VSSDRESNSVHINNIANGIEAVGNLIYLICEDADHPSLVRQYANMCEERLRVIATLLKEMHDDPDPRQDP